jgi:hypothetical protein
LKIYYKNNYKFSLQNGAMPLSHLPIARFVSSDIIVVDSIKESPFYKSLKHNDQNIFEKYRRVMCHIPNQLSWCQFLELKEKIALEGFKNSQDDKKKGGGAGDCSNFC